MKIPTGLKRTAVLSVLRNGNRLLLLKRKNPPHPGKYTPVGGKLDPFESPRAATIRETFEETGIQISNPRYGGLLVENSPSSYNWTCFVYIAEIEAISPPPCNEGELTWIAVDQLSQADIPATDSFIYEYLLSGKPFMFNADYDLEENLIALHEEISDVVLYRR